MTVQLYTVYIGYTKISYQYDGFKSCDRHLYVFALSLSILLIVITRKKIWRMANNRGEKKTPVHWKAPLNVFSGIFSISRKHRFTVCICVSCTYRTRRCIFLRHMWEKTKSINLLNCSYGNGFIGLPFTVSKYIENNRMKCNKINTSDTKVSNQTVWAKEKSYSRCTIALRHT